MKRKAVTNESFGIAILRGMHLFASVFAAMLSLCGTIAHSADTPIPTDSIYQLDILVTDQDGRALRLPTLRGQVRILSMFYASCPYVCPLTISTLEHIEKKLTPAQRANLGVVLISLDPQRDTSAALKTLALERNLDETRWRLLHTDGVAVRKIAAVLGIQYRQLENQNFNHSSALILLDADGRALARSSQMGDPDPDFIAAVATALSR
jgi:protein SCO1/2